MFVGHYGISFAAKRAAPQVPLAALFFAVQLLDVGWSILVFLGIEKVRIVPGITATNPLDLYYMPFTHGLPAALVWSVAAALLARVLFRGVAPAAAWIVAAAVFSHWTLDFVVHRPDLPLYDDAAKVGLGLWNLPVVALGLEMALFFGGLWLYLGSGVPRRLGFLIFGVMMFGVQCSVFFGPPPPTPAAAAVMALASYVVFAVAAHVLERREQRWIGRR